MFSKQHPYSKKRAMVNVKNINGYNAALVFKSESNYFVKARRIHFIVHHSILLCMILYFKTILEKTIYQLFFNAVISNKPGL